MTDAKRTRFASPTNIYADCGYDELIMHARNNGVLLPPYQFKSFVAAASVLAAPKLGPELRDALYDFVAHEYVENWYKVHTENTPIGLEPSWHEYFETLHNSISEFSKIEFAENRKLHQLMYVTAAKWSRGYREHYQHDDASFRGMPPLDIAREVLMEYIDIISYLISLRHQNEESLSGTQISVIQNNMNDATKRALNWCDAWQLDLINVAADLFK